MTAECREFCPRIASYDVEIAGQQQRWDKKVSSICDQAEFAGRHGYKGVAPIVRNDIDRLPDEETEEGSRFVVSLLAVKPDVRARYFMYLDNVNALIDQKEDAIDSLESSCTLGRPTSYKKYWLFGKTVLKCNVPNQPPSLFRKRGPC